jgi:AhpD family alkylhydroperoxidase
MDLRRYELAPLAASDALRCRYCLAAHAEVVESKFYDRPQLEAITRDYRSAGPDPVDVAIMAFAEKVAHPRHYRCMDRTRGEPPACADSKSARVRRPW